MLRSSIWASALLLLLVGCGGKNCYPPTALSSFGSDTSAADLNFDSTVPADQQSLIKQDLARLGTLSLEENKEDSCTVGIATFSGTNLVQYLKTRVRYVVGESYDYKKPTVSSQPSGGTTVYAALGENTRAESNVVTVMTNIGAALYLAAKKESALATLTIASTAVPIYSPRDGVIQIGAGMFVANNVPSSAKDALVNSLLRLSVFLHEARHSDGHGDHTAFGHIKCTEGTYAGEAACERFANGPYSVQGTMVAKLYDACTNCTMTERMGMMRLAADYFSRVRDDASSEDDRPEGYAQRTAAR